MSDIIELNDSLSVEEFGVLSFNEDGDDCQEDEAKPISSLPEEVLLHIFSHLSLYDLYKSIALVCKQFLRLSRDPTIRKCLCIKGSVRSAFAQDFISESSNLKSLILRNRRDANQLLTTALYHCKRLTHLEAHFCSPLTQMTLKTMSESPIVGQLRNLTLEGTGVCSNEESSKTVFESQRLWQNVFASMGQLRHLDLFCCRFIEAEDLLNIGQYCTHLEYLNLEEVTHLCLASLATLLISRKETLRTLYLDGETANDEFFQHLNQCRKLEKLGIAFADGISTQGMEAISELTSLTSLKLMRAKELPPIEFITTFSNSNLKHLTYLNLAECCLFDDDALEAVASTCHRLEELILNWCWELTDEGVEKVIWYCGYLRTLSLVGVVRITESILLDIGVHLPELEFLNLEQCPDIDDSHLAEIVRMGRPNMRIVNYWGETLMRCTTNPFFPNSVVEEEGEVTSSTQKSF